MRFLYVFFRETLVELSSACRSDLMATLEFHRPLWNPCLIRSLCPWPARRLLEISQETFRGCLGSSQPRPGVLSSSCTYSVSWHVLTLVRLSFLSIASISASGFLLNRFVDALSSILSVRCIFRRLISYMVIINASLWPQQQNQMAVNNTVSATILT